MKKKALLLIMFCILFFFNSTDIFNVEASVIGLKILNTTETYFMADTMQNDNDNNTPSVMEDTKLEKELSWDWINFWQNLIATFLGFILAIIGEFVVARIMQRHEEVQIKAGILKELDLICEQLRQNVDNGSLFPPAIETSYWDGIVGGTKLDLINTKIWYEKLASIYSRVNEINEWFKQKSNYALLSISENQDNSKKYEKISKVFEEHIINESKEEQGTLMALIHNVKGLMS